MTDRILEALKNNGGRLDFDDDSHPEAIRSHFEASKKAFKQALGSLYKQRRIEFTRPGIASIDVRAAKDGDWEPSKRS